MPETAKKRCLVYQGEPALNMLSLTRLTCHDKISETCRFSLAPSNGLFEENPLKKNGNKENEQPAEFEDLEQIWLDLDSSRRRRRNVNKIYQY